MSFRERYLNRHMLLELGLAAVFFVANHVWDLMTATAVVMAATVLTTVLGFVWWRSVPVLPLVTLALVLIRGGTTLVFHDELFIKIKSTIGSLLFAAVLVFGLLLERSLLERALGYQVFLTREGWRVLTWRWIALALVTAVINEVGWRTLSTDAWVTVKTIETLASIVCYILITRLTASRYWNGPEP